MRDPLILFIESPYDPYPSRGAWVPAARDAIGWRNYNAERGDVPGRVGGEPTQWDPDVAVIFHLVVGVT